MRHGVQPIERRGSQAIADITFLDHAGQLVARMRGAECTSDAGLVEVASRKAFARAFLLADTHPAPGAEQTSVSIR